MNESELRELLQEVNKMRDNAKLGSKKWWYLKGVSDSILNELYNFSLVSRRTGIVAKCESIIEKREVKKNEEDTNSIC